MAQSSKPIVFTKSEDAYKQEVSHRIHQANDIYDLYHALQTLEEQAPDDYTKVMMADARHMVSNNYSDKKKLRELAQIDPIIPGINTPADWADVKGLSEKFVEIAKAKVRRMDQKKIMR